MKRLVFFVVITVLMLTGFMVTGHASNPVSETDRQTLQVAGGLYNSGLYTEASHLYQQLVDQGVVSVELYYNLGSAYARMDDWGHAILNYIRAQRLDPRDPDIRTNLESVLAKAGIQADELARSPLERLLDFAQSTFTGNELAVLALASWLGITLLWLVRTTLQMPVIRRIVGAALLVNVLVLLFAGYATFYNQQIESTGVVVTPVTLSGTDLKAGTQVNILEQRGQQLRVKLPGLGFDGWVARDTIEMI